MTNVYFKNIFFFIWIVLCFFKLLDYQNIKTFNINRYIDFINFIDYLFDDFLIFRFFCIGWIIFLIIDIVLGEVKIKKK